MRMRKVIRGIVLLSALLLSLASGESTTNQQPKSANTSAAMLDQGTTAHTAETVAKMATEIANTSIKMAISDTTDTTSVKIIATDAELDSTCINDTSTTASVNAQMTSSRIQESTLTNLTNVNETTSTQPNLSSSYQTSNSLTNATNTSTQSNKTTIASAPSTEATVGPNSTQSNKATIASAPSTETTVGPNSTQSNQTSVSSAPTVGTVGPNSTQSNKTTIASAPSTEATVGPNSTQSNQTTITSAPSTEATVGPNSTQSNQTSVASAPSTEATVGPNSTQSNQTTIIVVNSTEPTIVPNQSPSSTLINATGTTISPNLSSSYQTSNSLTNVTNTSMQSNQTTSIVASSTETAIAPITSLSTSTLTNTSGTTVIPTTSPVHQTTSNITNATKANIGPNSTQSSQTTTASMNFTEVTTAPTSFQPDKSTSTLPNATVTTDSTLVATTPMQIICPPFYFFNKTSNQCDDIDECVIPGICASPQFVCKNLVGNYTCSCPEGFRFESGSCKDINECEDKKDNCSSLKNFTCKNRNGGFSCICKENFTMKSDGNCYDVNECTLKLHNCDQICINTDGGYNCSCVEGFTYNQTISKCTNLTKPCTSRNCGVGKGFCIPGSNGTLDKCHCFSGYNINATSGICENINECNFVNCGNGTCFDDNPGFHCKCDAGYAVSNDTGFCSIDINECDENPDICGKFSKCTNSPGNYACKCLDGYETERSDGKSCHEIDGCARNNDNGTNFCSTRNRECISNLGEFVCSSCIPPFIDQGPDTICTSVNTIAGTIVNGNIALLREFNSKLNTGFSKYQLEEELRIALTEALQQTGTPKIIGFGLINVRNGSVICNYTMQFDGEIATDNVTKALVKSCANGAGPSGSCFLSDKLVVKASSITHTEYIPCESDSTFLCSEKGNCSSVKKGSYTCTCLGGYEDMNIHDNVTNCVDKNECEQTQGICGSALCINMPGSFYCKCPDCQRYNPKSGLCRDICNNGGKCEAFDYSENYYCRCTSGFEGPLCDVERGNLESSERNVAIVGGVLGGALAIVLIVCAVLIFRLKKVKRAFSSCEDFDDVNPVRISQVRLIQLMQTDFE